MRRKHNHGPAALTQAVLSCGTALRPRALALLALRPPGLKTMAEKRQLFVEMRAQNFDVIRLLTYTTVLSQNNSIVQKQCNLHLVDTWNMIESFETMV